MFSKLVPASTHQNSPPFLKLIPGQKSIIFLHSKHNPQKHEQLNFPEEKAIKTIILFIK